MARRGRPRLEEIVDLRTYPRRFVRPLQLHRYTGIPLRTLYHHIEKGALPSVKRGGICVITIEAARAYAATPA